MAAGDERFIGRLKLPSVRPSHKKAFTGKHMGAGHSSVYWSLERMCRLRTGDDWFRPKVTREQLTSIRRVAAVEAGGQLFEGVLVHASTESDFSGNEYQFPSCGWTLNKVLGSREKWELAKETCAGCPANLNSGLPTRVVGCFGVLSLWHDSRHVERALWTAIERLNCHEEYRASFLMTTPLWYGLWTASPLAREQKEVLLPILESVLSDDMLNDDDHCHEITQFVNAVRVSLAQDLPLHVALPIPEYRSETYREIQAHCPRCKAEPALEHRSEFRGKSYNCQVCGQTYVVQNIRHPWEPPAWSPDPPLSEVMGQTEYVAFARRYLQHQGGTLRQVNEVLENHHCEPLVREVAKVRRNQYCSREAAKRQVQCETIRDLPEKLMFALANDTRLELVLIQPASETTVSKPFYIGRELVTQRQWEATIDCNPFRDKDRAQMLVNDLTWLDGQAFCESLSRRFNKLFRLPSEAEWELACRLGQMNPTDSVDRYEWLEDGAHAPFEATAWEVTALLKDDHRKAHRVVRGPWRPDQKTAARRLLRIDGTIPLEPFTTIGIEGPGEHVACSFRVVCEAL